MHKNQTILPQASEMSTALIKGYDAMITFFKGATLTAGLIISLGPQNIELIRLGLLKQNAFLMASVFIFCDIMLVVFGAAGVGSLIASQEIVLIITKYIATFMLYYLSYQAFMRIRNPIQVVFDPCASGESGLTNDPISEIAPDIEVLETRLHSSVSLSSLNEVFDENSPERHFDPDSEKKAVKKTIRKGLMLSFFNPLVLLETLILVGSASAQYAFNERIYFIMGSLFTSFFWFYSMALSAKQFSLFFENPNRQQMLEIFVCVIMAVMGTLIMFNT